MQIAGLLAMIRMLAMASFLSGLVSQQFSSEPSFG
jgi:hypothetical protein